MAAFIFSRRHFMGLSGAGVADIFSTSWPVNTALAQIGTSQEPDHVVLNARVYTVDPLEPRAEAFAVKGGRFIAIGRTDDVKALIGRRTEVYDAKAMTVVPGFIDAHNHAPGPIL